MKAKPIFTPAPEKGVLAGASGKGRPDAGLKVLMVCKSLPDTFKGGIQTHVMAMCEGLLLRGHQVNILAAGSFLKKPFTEVWEGCQVIRVPSFPGRRMPVLKKTLEEAAFAWASWRWLKKNGHQYDIIHSQGRSGAILPRSLWDQVKWVSTFHGLIRLETHIPGQRRSWNPDEWLHRSLARWMEQRAHRHAHGAIYVSKEMERAAQQFIGTANGCHQIIYNGILSHKGPVPTLDSSSPFLLFVGLLDRRKGIFPLIEAMSHIPKEIRLVMIGEGPARKELERRIRQLGLENRVRLLGDQDRTSVRSWMLKARGVILPSFYETQGIVLMEANVLGRPVLTSAIGGTTEVVQHEQNGLLFPPGDVLGIAAAIHRLFSESDLARQLGENGRQQMKARFSWEKSWEETESMYYQLLKS